MNDEYIYMDVIWSTRSYREKSCNYLNAFSTMPAMVLTSAFAMVVDFSMNILRGPLTTASKANTAALRLSA